MLYYLFEYLQKTFDLPGSGLFQYISFRTLLATSTPLILTIFFGGKVIDWIKSRQMREEIRDLGLEGQKEKTGTPTMGGIIVIAFTLISVFLFTEVFNFYIVVLTLTLLWMGFVGFLDDYFKIKRHNKKGIKGKYKIYGQVILGIGIAVSLYFSEDFITYEFPSYTDSQNAAQILKDKDYIISKNIKTTIPFLKNNELDYKNFLPSWLTHEAFSWLLFMFALIFIVSSVSNGANLTDGIDGLLTGTSIIICTTLGLLAYFSGNVIFSVYLKIMYIPNVSEIVVFSGALTGALIGFFWYNTYPAQIFLGDTGSLSIGAVISVIAVLIKKELMLPIICGIFVLENLSVIIQVGFFKYTKRKYGIGKRIFKMAPLHHHYQKINLHESKIANRFLIIGVLLALLALATLKVR